MIGPNLSEWALKKRSLVVFLMILAVVAGVMSFFKLGRGEDPAFTTRTMVVAAGWPGATVDETMKQVTERLERTLQETDYLDRLRSYTIAGQTTIFVDLKQSTPPQKVPDIWYQVRKNIGDMRHTLPQGVLGPFLNDDFGDTFGIIYGFTADGFGFRELRDHVEAARSRLLQLPDVSKIEVMGAQDEQIFIEFSTERLAGLRLNLNQIVATLQAQNLVRPAGTIQGEQERVFLRVSGAFDSERDIEAVNIVAGERIFRLGDIATVRRGFTDPPQPMFRVNGKPAIGLAIAMRDAGDILALGENVRKEMAEIKANLPVGIEPVLVADQAVTVDHRDQRLHDLAVAGHRHHPGVQLRQPGDAPGHGGGAGHSADDGDRLRGHGRGQHRPAPHLAGCADHRARDAGRRRDDHGGRDAAPAGRRRHPGPGRDLCLPHAGCADADRHAGHDRQLRADRLRQELGRRVHLLDLLGGRHLADRQLAGGGDLRAADRQGAAQAAEAAADRGQAGQAAAGLQRLRCRGRSA